VGRPEVYGEITDTAAIEVAREDILRIECVHGRPADGVAQRPESEGRTEFDEQWSGRVEATVAREPTRCVATIDPDAEGSMVTATASSTPVTNRKDLIGASQDRGRIE
jgi:hypothetical protein